MRQQFAGFTPPPPPQVLFKPCETNLGLGGKPFLLFFSFPFFSFSFLQKEERALGTPEKSEPHPKFTPQHPPRFQVLGKGDTSGFGGWEELFVPHMGQDLSLGPQQAQRHLAMEQGQGWSCGISIPLLLPMALHPKGELATPAHPPDRGRREGPSPVQLQGN